MNITVFCGASTGHDPRWRELAHHTGRALAQQGWTVVYGGGNTGLMGALADGALEAGGEVIGVMVELLVARERAHQGLTRLEIVATMAARKERLIALADACVALPGGLGTLDELYEVMTFYQLGLSSSWSWLLNPEGYYDLLQGQMARMQAEGFIHGDILPISSVDTLPALINGLKNSKENWHV